MNREDVLAAFDRQLRRELRPDEPRARRERAGAVIRQFSPADGWSGVLWSELDETTADAEIAAQIRDFTAAGCTSFEWKLYSYDRPADLGERLRAAGFEPEPEETLMAAEVAGLPSEAQPPPGVRFEPVTDPAGVELVVDVHEQAFTSDSSWLRGRLLAQLREQRDTAVAVIAMAGDVPVSASRMELNPGTDFAGLWGGGTVPAWRGRGIYRALVAFRTRIAAEHGYRYLQVDASDQSRPILRRLGFEPLATTTPWVYNSSH